VSLAEGIEVLRSPYKAAPEKAPFRRKDLATLLNNWLGEIDRWRSWAKPIESDVKPLQDESETPPFLDDTSAIFHK
jgi:hypothetical protein